MCCLYLFGYTRTYVISLLVCLIKYSIIIKSTHTRSLCRRISHIHQVVRMNQLLCSHIIIDGCASGILKDSTKMSLANAELLAQKIQVDLIQIITINISYNALCKRICIRSVITILKNLSNFI